MSPEDIHMRLIKDMYAIREEMDEVDLLNSPLTTTCIQLWMASGYGENINGVSGYVTVSSESTPRELIYKHTWVEYENIIYDMSAHPDDLNVRYTHNNTEQCITNIRQHINSAVQQTSRWLSVFTELSDRGLLPTSTRQICWSHELDLNKDIINKKIRRRMTKLWVKHPFRIYHPAQQ